MPKHLRLKAFHHFLHPYQAAARLRRSRWFISAMGIEPDMRIIDLGGTPMIWALVDLPLDITLLNIKHELKAFADAGRNQLHKFSFVKGDACDIDLPSNSFDIAFSNSVIEHVGDKARRSAFAKHVRRLAPKYWVQTPAKSFPIEAHTGMPFWWFYPEGLRQALIRKWRQDLSLWTEMIEGTTIVERSELREIFPDAIVAPERSFGIVKSYVAFRS